MEHKKVMKMLNDKTVSRPFNENGKKDGNWNYIHRADVGSIISEILKIHGRIEYLARVLYTFMAENGIAAECPIDYDETTCDGMCLAQDLINELEIDIDD